MPLSTSSSDHIDTRFPLRKTWVVALVLVLVLMGSWEGFWRIKGFTPAIEDDQELWFLIRSKINRNTRAVFIGASRIQLGVHPDVFADQTGTTPLILAVDGNPPFSVLHHIAEDPAFKGTLFCSIHPRWLAEKPPKKDRAAKWARKYRPPSLLDRVELELSLLLQQTFVFRYPGLSPSKVWEKWKEGEWPQSAYSRIRKDRYREADFTPENTPKILASRIRRIEEFKAASDPVTGGAYLKRLQDIDADVRKIEARGGRVIFIRMPSSGRVKEVETEIWSRANYWETFIKMVSGIKIHYEDHAALKDFKCPDGSHMSLEDAKEFTRRLLDLLVKEYGVRI